MAQLVYKAPLKAPLTVSLWVTEGCNLTCRYCYAEAGTGAYADTSRLLHLIDELAELEVFDLTIAGGEPFLHPDIYHVIDHALSRDLQLGVLTNGTLFDQDTCQRLAGAVGDRKFILQVSLDSADPAINDLTRGHGQKVLDALGLLMETDIELQISCVLSRHNIESAHLLLDHFYPRIKRFHFLNIQRTRRTLENPELLVGDDEAHSFWERLHHHSQNFPDDLFLPSLRIMMRSYGEEECHESHRLHQQATFDCSSCSVGLTKVEIDAGFNVLGCDIAKDFSLMGNIRHSSFEEVWHSAKAHKVRNMPFPPCYQIEGPDGKSLADQLKPEYQTR